MEEELTPSLFMLEVSESVENVTPSLTVLNLLGVILPSIVVTGPLQDILCPVDVLAVSGDEYRGRSSSPSTPSGRGEPVGSVADTCLACVQLTVAVGDSSAAWLRASSASSSAVSVPSTPCRTCFALFTAELHSAITDSKLYRKQKDITWNIICNKFR